MTSNVELLPLPEWAACDETVADMSTTDVREAMNDYARACVEANTEALRAEVAELEEANRQLHAHGEMLYARVTEMIEAGKALPAPRFAQVITFEGSDYVLVSPDDFDALHAALHPTAAQEDGRE